MAIGVAAGGRQGTAEKAFMFYNCPGSIAGKTKEVDGTIDDDIYDDDIYDDAPDLVEVDA